MKSVNFIAYDNNPFSDSSLGFYIFNCSHPMLLFKFLDTVEQLFKILLIY